MGLATTAALCDAGAKVIMLCRSEERGREALAKLKEKEERQLELIICDLGDYDSIRDFARTVKAKYARIDILVNNAGFISLDRQETKEGLERQFGINHIGHFLLTITYLIEGELLHTPGHSDDSISLWLDEGSLFVGDLNPLYELELHKGTEIGKSWDKLLALDPKTVYYGHAKTAVLDMTKNDEARIEIKNK